MKTNSEMLKKIQFKDNLYYLDSKEIFYLELCGFILVKTPVSILIVDFYGCTELFFKELKISNNVGSFICKVVPRIRKNKITFFCTEIKKISIFEEIAFHLEVKAIVKSFCKPFTIPPSS